MPPVGEIDLGAGSWLLGWPTEHALHVSDADHVEPWIRKAPEISYGVREGFVDLVLRERMVVGGREHVERVKQRPAVALLDVKRESANVVGDGQDESSQPAYTRNPKQDLGEGKQHGHRGSDQSLERPRAHPASQGPDQVLAIEAGAVLALVGGDCQPSTRLQKAR